MSTVQNRTMTGETSVQTVMKSLASAQSALLAGIREGITAVKQAVQPVDSSVQNLYRGVSWRNFRRYWQENGIFKKDPDHHFDSFYKVKGTAAEQLEILSETTLSHCNSLVEYGLPLQHKKILRGLMLSRLHRKYRGSCRMQSRMVPAIGTVNSSWTVSRLEKSTDLLIKLRKSETISSRDLTRGLETIRKEIASISICDLIGRLFDAGCAAQAGKGMRKAEILGNLIDRIDLNFRKYMQRFAKQTQDYPARYAEKMLLVHKKMKQEIRELRKNLPALITLFGELEK